MSDIVTDRQADRQTFFIASSGDSSCNLNIQHRRCCIVFYNGRMIRINLAFGINREDFTQALLTETPAINMMVVYLHRMKAPWTETKTDTSAKNRILKEQFHTHWKRQYIAIDDVDHYILCDIRNPYLTMDAGNL